MRAGKSVDTPRKLRQKKKSRHFFYFSNTKPLEAILTFSFSLSFLILCRRNAHLRVMYPERPAQSALRYELSH